MGKLLVLALVAVIAWKMIIGRWPWQPRISAGKQALFNARKLLGVSSGATRQEILSAHRQLVAAVHPDRGGSNTQIHEANAARDLLLAELPHDAVK
ncbi:molecular chaperone DnaJ [Altererythrobacter sp. B11]|uniref:DnaJ domain-containing protein n=1 Tax=Altererythrobacter sp. B11 TaxID=2060312 RepID=UPI000DC6E396|nr:DnaJ domain-containing protein [Altererythrobacter sp. B11]BBC71540.1 molecular chaperone DnaJ [Altererythrobacter sp. B11]